MPLKMSTLLALTVGLLLVSIAGSDNSTRPPSLGAQQLYKYFDRDSDGSLNKQELKMIVSEILVNDEPTSWSCLASVRQETYWALLSS